MSAQWYKSEFNELYIKKIKLSFIFDNQKKFKLFFNTQVKW